MPSQKSEIFFIDSLKKVKKKDWNSCVDNDHPFIQYEFLFALEESKSACSQTGWKPYHYIEYNNKSEIIKMESNNSFLNKDLSLTQSKLCSSFQRFTSLEYIQRELELYD